MPIHDQGYRRYAGGRTSRGGAWLVIARAGIVARVRERRFLALMLVAWLLFLVRAVQLYVGTTIVRASFFAASEETFHGFLNQQRLFVFFVRSPGMNRIRTAWGSGTQAVLLLGV